MIIATYKQWSKSGEYLDRFYKEYTSIYEDKFKLLERMKNWEKAGNPMIISGIWELQ